MATSVDERQDEAAPVRVDDQSDTLSRCCIPPLALPEDSQEQSSFWATIKS